MKAGAFGRPPERRQVQPGGRVLPGMFASPSPSPAPAAAPTTSSRQAPTSTAAQPKLANPGGALLSSWGTAGRSSGRLPATTAPSRLERLASGRGSSDGGSDGPTRGGNAASISRARKLGLNRRARTPSPPSSPEYSPERSPPRSPSPPPSHQRARAASQAASSPFTRQRDRAASASPPPGTRPRRASSPPPVAAAPVAPGNEAGEQPQGLLSSLWGRATQLVGGSAAGQQPGVVREVGHNRANSVDSSLPVPQSHVTPFQLHDGAHAGDEHESHVAPTPKEPSTLRNTRPIALPPLVAPARTLTTSSTPAARRISAPPGLARAASEPLPPIEPITYHRPPPLHPRDAPPPSSLRRRTAAHTSPYDWLESRDEAPLEPFLFTRALGRAPTKRGGRAARRPAMPQGVRTEPGPRGAAEGIAAGGLVGAAAAGGMAAARAHAQVHASIPPLAPPAFNYAASVHPGAPPAAPVQTSAAPTPSVAPAFAPSAPPPFASAPAPAPPLVAPAQPWSAAPVAHPLAATASTGFFAQAPTSYGPATTAATAPPIAPHPAAEAPEHEEAAQTEALPSYEPRPPSREAAETREEEQRAHVSGAAPQVATHEEPLGRSGAGPDSLPIFPSPLSGVSQPPPASAAPVSAAPPAPMPPSSYAQAAYPQAPYPQAAYSQAAAAQPSYPATSQAPLAPPPLVPPAPLAPTSQPYTQPYVQAQPSAQQYTVSAPVPTAFTAAPVAAPVGASASDDHYAAHFGTAGGPSLSGVLPRLFAAALPAAAVRPGAGPSATPPEPATAAAPSASSPSGAVPPAHSDLPAGPPILPVTPPPAAPTPPVPPVSQAAPPATHSLYTSHLAAVRGVPSGPLGQTSWGAPPVAPGTTLSLEAGRAGARMPSPAAPSPAPSSAMGESRSAPPPSDVDAAVHEERSEQHEPEDEGEELPGYEALSADSLASLAAPSDKAGLSLPPHTAVQTPLPPSPAPPPLPVEPSSGSPAAQSGTPDVPPRPSSLLLNTVAPPPEPVSSTSGRQGQDSQIVLIPPTPLEPHPDSPPTSTQHTELDNTDAFSATRSPTSESAPAVVAVSQPSPGPSPGATPAPALQPLELGFLLDDLGLSTLDFGVGLSDEIGSGESELVAAPLPWPERASSPAVQFGVDGEDEGEDEDEDEEAKYDDPAASSHDLDEAFDAATSFAASFAEVDLSRARVDPGHSARTDRWLEQQGVERKSVGELRPQEGGVSASGADAGVVDDEQAGPPGFYRPRPAPPASIAPSLLTPQIYVPHAASSPPSSTKPHTRATSLSYQPQLAFLSTVRESASPSADDSGANAQGPPSPLETSIGRPEAALHRSRAVSVDEVARRADIERATVTVPAGTAQAALSDAAFVGDKGETASEVAAMFAHW
ncbi:hypothetical protein DMC30DRAFT_443905 [Rhodotorula diobovata]|uniref:Uncharacterized protein n=1 Tax=Rhodotorula diobovata TaxID=5288 RepID=A0A5C5G681_9BASI|nr:hypothetical protein DMC30DRAFT_443905 [Rhodotorula diobovata]